MNHFSRQQWKEYIESPHHFSTMEEHLFSCDECLATYLEVSSEQEEHTFQEDFTTNIMSTVSKLDLYEKEKPKQKWYETTIFHYTLAASLTIMLVSGGFFTTILDWTDSIEEKPSFTERVMHEMYNKKQLIEEENN